MHFLCSLFLLRLDVAVASCLANATRDRKNLVEEAESNPIGIWRSGDYAAAHLTSMAAKILIEEKLGYNVELKGPGKVSADAFFALMGCTTPSNTASRGCGPEKITSHISFEVWTAFYAETWNQIQNDFQEQAPRNLGNMGYNGVTAPYVSDAVQQTAYNAESINLDFYRDYNASRQHPGKYFAQSGDLDVSRLLPCTGSVLMSSGVMREYVEMTDDWAGVVVEGDEVIGKCVEEYFWFSPACRDQTSCVTWLTGGSGWGMSEMLIKATAYNIPLATSVAKDYQNFQTLPVDFKMIMYWWVPDPSFLRLKPRKITFPAHDADEWAKGDRRTAAFDVSVDKLVSHNLHSAPDIEELVSSFTLSLKTVDKMMMDQLDTNDADYDVACRWLQSNEETWKTWLPERGKCFSQFGMYDEKSQRFLQNRDPIAISCRACPSGHFSAPFKDDVGSTFICQECASGYFQESGASLFCLPCPAGSQQNNTGSSACNRCPVGEYQDVKGSSLCKACPAHATTALLGSVSVSDCGCQEGFINIADVAQGEMLCVPCGEGLKCPFASSIQTLQSGQSSLGEQFVTRIRKGYFATPADPLQIFHCRPDSWCPGGTPGTCAGNFEGMLCDSCPIGKSHASGECDDCGATWVGWIVGLLVYLTAVPRIYYFVNNKVTAHASPFKTCQMSVGLGLTSIQVLAVLGMMSAKWPITFDRTASGFRFIMLDLDGLGLSCLTGNWFVLSYVVTTLIFPFTVLWLAFCHAMSWCFRRPWKIAFTLNTLGLGLQLSFGTTAAVALKPFMCYIHPNGRQSVLSYPSIFCGDQRHGLMLACGIFLLGVFVLGFIGVCCYAVWKLPVWSSMGHYKKVQSFRFCTSNFRFDSYWFVLILLFRGLGFALTVAVGTNLPSAQICIASLILVAYSVMQNSTQPWKAPVVNLADMILSTCFLLLVNTDIPKNEKMEEEFADYFAVVLLLLLLICLVLLALVCMVGLSLQAVGGEWKWILQLDLKDTSKLTQELKDCAAAIMAIETASLSKDVEDMNSYDVNTILNFINLAYADIPGLSNVRPLASQNVSRVNLAVLNHDHSKDLSARTWRTSTTSNRPTQSFDDHQNEMEIPKYENPGEDGAMLRPDLGEESKSSIVSVAC